MEKEPIKSHEDLEVYKMAFDVAMKIFELSKKFPVEERSWLKFAVKCGYLDVDTARELYGVYNRVLGILVTIINNPSPWLIKR
ncbi:four helix bundle protein [Nostoc sp. 'Peltigera membranacea cyanobiont' 232]|uniref:four helix bundle protein n=1 Tax=Nostoc sp. 'Peltigera membranacea cyanobiont' 232 TaxID=2014531 RepID=UPI000B9592DD|nr:four helix bundle protein [Nostoc sp. 'Peltigera membranacea cyanobiont' 232]OYD99984.1 hypothetical protein CDG79_37720 [Nostoc sp. 'Peltigera membranacea cyanobiont' 232]